MGGKKIDYLHGSRLAMVQHHRTTHSKKQIGLEEWREGGESISNQRLAYCALALGRLLVVGDFEVVAPLDMTISCCDLPLIRRLSLK